MYTNSNLSFDISLAFSLTFSCLNLNNAIFLFTSKYLKILSFNETLSEFNKMILFFSVIALYKCDVSADSKFE